VLQYRAAMIDAPYETIDADLDDDDFDRQDRSVESDKPTMNRKVSKDHKDVPAAVDLEDLDEFYANAITRPMISLPKADAEKK